MSVISALALSLSATALQGTPPATGPNSQIIVQGQNERAEIAKFVDQLAPTAADTQLAKFLAPICPGVIGLPDGQGKMVEDRIRKVAATVGAPVAPASCEPNVVVMVVRDKRVAIEDFEKKQPDMLGGLPGDVINRLKNVPGPAVGWQVTGVIGEDGMPLPWVRFGGALDVAARQTRMSKSFAIIGRLQQATVPQFLASVLLVEDRALDKLTTVQFADYAAMRTLAPISWRQRPLPSRSILNLLSPGAKFDELPLSVTWWDVAMLKSLYASSNSVPADIQRSAIANLMDREIRKVPPDQR